MVTTIDASPEILKQIKSLTNEVADLKTQLKTVQSSLNEAITLLRTERSEFSGNSYFIVDREGNAEDLEAFRKRNGVSARP